MNEYCMESQWEPRHNSFCSYWRATMLRMIVVSMVALFAGTLLTMLGVATYNDPVAVISVILGVIAFFASLIGVFFVGYTIKDRIKKNADQPKSLFVQKYIAYKSKVCPAVEFEK